MYTSAAGAIVVVHVPTCVNVRVFSSHCAIIIVACFVCLCLALARLTRSYSSRSEKLFALRPVPTFAPFAPFATKVGERSSTFLHENKIVQGMAKGGGHTFTCTIICTCMYTYTYICMYACVCVCLCAVQFSLQVDICVLVVVQKRNRKIQMQCAKASKVHGHVECAAKETLSE